MSQNTKTLHERFHRAVNFEKSGEYADALTEYVSIIKEDKNFREAYLNLGSLYSRMNRLEKAMKCYALALKLKKDYLTFFNIGSIHYKRKEYKKAIFNLEKSKSINRTFALSTLVMGLCFSRLNNIKAAETNFLEVLNFLPYNRVALTALAIMYYNGKRYDEAIIFLNKVLDLNSSTPGIRELKNEILYKSGKIDEFTREIKTQKKTNYSFRLYDEFIKSVPVEAITDRYGTIDEKICKLTEKDDNDGESLITLSLCHLFKGDTDRAIDYLMEARKRFLD